MTCGPQMVPALVRKVADASGGHARLQPRTTTGLDAIVILPGIVNSQEPSVRTAGDATTVHAA
jgi:hypothetical protein